MFLCRVKGYGLPRRFAPRNDRWFESSAPICAFAQEATFRDGTEAVPYGVFFTLHFLFRLTPVSGLLPIGKRQAQRKSFAKGSLVQRELSRSD